MLGFVNAMLLSFTTKGLLVTMDGCLHSIQIESANENFHCQVQYTLDELQLRASTFIFSMRRRGNDCISLSINKLPA